MDHIEQLKKYGACSDGLTWAQDNTTSAKEMWDTCEKPEWLLWLAKQVNQTDAKVYIRIALEIAWDALPIWEKEHPTDSRPRNALVTTQKWLDGQATVEEVRVTRRECAPAAAAYYAAATAAYYAAAAAYYAAYAACSAATAADAYYAAATAAYYAAATAAYYYADDDAKIRYCNIIRKHIPVCPLNQEIV